MLCIMFLFCGTANAILVENDSRNDENSVVTGQDSQSEEGKLFEKDSVKENIDQQEDVYFNESEK